MPRVAISNASPLIFLVKISILEALKQIYDKILITSIVKHECVDAGKQIGSVDALSIEKLILEGFIEVLPLTDSIIAKAKSIAKESKTSLGEITTILLAKENQISNIIVDDKRARTLAKIHGLEPRGTISLILELAKKGFISKEDAKKLVDKLISAGFWMSVELYKGIVDALEGL